MNTKTHNKGFTLIELLVVIAIIGILASIITSDLNTARAKGADGAIKSNMDNMRSQASIYYDDNGHYFASDPSDTTCPAEGLYSDERFVSQIQGVRKAAGEPTTNVLCTGSTGSEGKWAVASLEKNPSAGMTHWCTDSEGYSGEIGITDTGAVVVADDTCALIDAR